MKVTIRSFVVVLILQLVFLVTYLDAASKHKKSIQGVMCGTKACVNPADLCCTNNIVNSNVNQCYNPLTHNCLPDQYTTGKNSLCPAGHYAGCAGVCFDSNVYYCDPAIGKIKLLSGVIKSTSSLSDQTVIKAINTAQSGWTAGSNPAFAGKTIAQVQVLAGTRTGSPPVVTSTRSINKVQAWIPITNIKACLFCGKGDMCCNGVCFSPLTHHCINGFLCPLNHYRCGNACYRPNAYSCYPGNVLCPYNTLPCGTKCYTASQNDCCDNVIRPKGYCPGGIPIAFSAASKWPSCIGAIGNQGSCGSCWAFSASQILGDRYCIAKYSPTSLSLSAQYQVSCDTGNFGCSGGYMDRTWIFLTNTGIPSLQCIPYLGVNTGCFAKCYNYTPIPKLYKSKNYYQLNGFDIPSVQREILANGPIHAAFTVYNDFFYYTSGVYSHTTGGVAGGHAVRVVGWGVESSTNKPYWIVANSWGTGFGMNGYFWISRGNNESGFESSMWRALAAG
jgi:cathepsin B